MEEEKSSAVDAIENQSSVWYGLMMFYKRRLEDTMRDRDELAAMVSSNFMRIRSLEETIEELIGDTQPK